jgi:hypothetical protein
MSNLNDWNNTKLIVQHHHNDLYKLTTPKALLDEPGNFTLVKPRPTVKQSVQLLAVALIFGVLRR